jgi:hypothetical protein
MKMDKAMLEQRVVQLKTEMEKAVGAVEHSVLMRNFLQGRLQEAMDWLQTFVDKELNATPAAPTTSEPAPPVSTEPPAPVSNS